jgi:hypothetical protein
VTWDVTAAPSSDCSFTDSKPSSQLRVRKARKGPHIVKEIAGQRRNLRRCNFNGRLGTGEIHRPALVGGCQIARFMRLRRGAIFILQNFFMTGPMRISTQKQAPSSGVSDQVGAQNTAVLVAGRSIAVEVATDTLYVALPKKESSGDIRRLIDICHEFHSPSR